MEQINFRSMLTMLILLGESISTMKRNTEASKEVGPEVNREKT